MMYFRRNINFSWFTGSLLTAFIWTLLFCDNDSYCGVNGFHLMPVPTTSRRNGVDVWQKPLVSLSAKKQSNKNKKNKVGAAAGGGFGASSSQTTKKSRSISSGSGYSVGAGNKALRDAANAFDRIRKIVGKEGTVDVYIKSPLNDPRRYWYAGKVAFMLDGDDINVKQRDAVLAQKRLILEYAKNVLRPQNLGGPRYSPTLEIWVAPGDSEMDCVQNKVSLQQCIGSTNDISDGFDVETVGFNPEIYVGEEQLEGGLRLTNLDENGKPTGQPFEINAGR